MHTRALSLSQVLLRHFGGDSAGQDREGSEGKETKEHEARGDEEALEARYAPPTLLRTRTHTCTHMHMHTPAKRVAYAC